MSFRTMVFETIMYSSSITLALFGGADGNRTRDNRLPVWCDPASLQPQNILCR